MESVPIETPRRGSHLTLSRSKSCTRADDPGIAITITTSPPTANSPVEHTSSEHIHLGTHVPVLDAGASPRSRRALSMKSPSKSKLLSRSPEIRRKLSHSFKVRMRKGPAEQAEKMDQDRTYWIMSPPQMEIEEEFEVRSKDAVINEFML